MNPLVKAVEEIKFRIPFEILKEAFRDDYQAWRSQAVSLDEQILSKVIRPRVMIDCNIVGGIHINIPLGQTMPISADQYHSIIEIPPELTGNRSILSVLAVGHLPHQANFNPMGGSMTYAAPTYMNSVTNAAQRISDAVSIIPILANTQIELIGHNTVMIREQWRIISAYYLRCMVTNDAEMRNIHPRYILNFAELCRLAVQSYIYKTLKIRIDQAYLQGGQELGAFKEFVETFSDSEELYQTYLREKWQAMAFMNDQLSYNRHIKLQISPGI